MCLRNLTLLGPAVILASAGAAQARDLSYELVNASGAAVVDVYFAPVTNRNWARADLPDPLLQPGGVANVTMSGPATGCNFDLKFVLASGDQALRRVNLCDLDSYTFEAQR